MKRNWFTAAAALALLVSCGGDGGGGDGGPVILPPGSTGGTGSSSSSGGTVPPVVYAVPAAESLGIADVEGVLARAATQAKADGKAATIAVVDRVGNVLAILRMGGAPASAAIPRAPDGNDHDIQGLTVPAEAAAVAKAITGAYLSSAGNAFSSRTASMIVQQHFPPAPSTAGLESGPLFGVQFSQLPCSDLAARFGSAGAGAMIGPKRSPLGLSADPGGFPLYKNGVVVGGVGVLANGVYGFDPDVLDAEQDADERIALAGTLGLEPPVTIRADRIYVDGTQLRYSDARYEDVTAAGGASYAATVPALGALVPLTGYTAGNIIAGTAYGTEASGVRPAGAADFGDPNAFVLTNGAGANRYPIRGGTDGGDIASPLTAAEARAILSEAFAVMTSARGQIRQPLDSRAQVSMALVDTRGAILGLVRAPDAPVFGIDVSVQKARSAAFFSNVTAGAQLLADPSADVRAFVTATRNFLADPAALTGQKAFSNRAIGNLARPYFPDGQLGTANGPLSRPVASFNPFSTGLQSALVLANLGEHLQFATGAAAADTPQSCTKLPAAADGSRKLANGLQIFPGSVPVYRGTTLVGAIGISGDGIDQDDMTAFLGMHNAGAKTGSIGNAAPAIRSDTISVKTGGSSILLRYVSCPFAPLIGSSEQNVCQGL